MPIVNFNPLNTAAIPAIQHVIVAFQNTQDAVATDVNVDIGETGTEGTGTACGGKYVVISNPLIDAENVVSEATMDWKYFSPLSPRTTSYSGNIMLNDRAGGLFAERLRNFAAAVGVAVPHLAIVWRMVFVYNDGSPQYVYTNPLIIHIVNFGQSMDDLLGKEYTLNWIAAYNTLAQMPNFAKMYASTISKLSSATVPQVNTTPVSNAVSTKALTAAFAQSRQARLDATSPMRTIGEMVDALEAQLNSQTRPHGADLQALLSNIKQGYSTKIKRPEQRKSQELPLKYTIRMNSDYRALPIDNRNLPFEQATPLQGEPGISGMTLPLGSTYYDALNAIMCMSKTVGIEHGAAAEFNTYKINCAAAIECDRKYHFVLDVSRYQRYDLVPDEFGASHPPRNASFVGNINPLHLTFQSLRSDGDLIPADDDIISITYSGATRYELNPLENDSEDVDTTSFAIAGDRELQTYERVAAKDFFKSGFSGVRTARQPFDISGVESSALAGNININSELRDTIYRIELRGNPNFLSDLSITPVQSAPAPTDWNYTFYENCHLFPMYLRTTIFIEPHSFIGKEIPAQKVPNRYYYDGFLHIISVRTKIVGGMMTHIITCTRSEDNF